MYAESPRRANPQIERLAQKLRDNGIAASFADALSLAQSISESNTAEERYGSEKIPNRYQEQRRGPGVIQNVRPEECGTPLAYLNRERRGPGRIENLPERYQKMPERQERPAPVQQAAVFAAEPDERTVRELVDEDAKRVYAQPVQRPVETTPAPKVDSEWFKPVAQVSQPVPQPVQPAPVVRPATPAQVQAPPQFAQPAPQPQAPPRTVSRHPPGSSPEQRGRGLSKEEESNTDISKIFYFGRR